MKENEWESSQTVEKNAGRIEKRLGRKIRDISSRDISEKKLMELAREHWKIESMHWILDVTSIKTSMISALLASNLFLTLLFFMRQA